MSSYHLVDLGQGFESWDQSELRILLLNYARLLTKAGPSIGGA